MASDIPKRSAIIIFASIGAVGLIFVDVLLMGSVFSDTEAMAGFAGFARHGALIPMGIGVLVGHWYTPIKDANPLVRHPYNYVILGVIAGTVVLVHVVLFSIFAAKGGSFGYYGNFIAFVSVLVGLALGASQWPVHMKH